MNIVKELRKKADMQQQELATAVGVSRPTVSEWESQKKDPSGPRLKKLAEIFGVDELVILGAMSQAQDLTDDTWVLREQIRRDPDLRILLSAATKASPEHIRAAAAMLKALEPKESSE